MILIDKQSRKVLLTADKKLDLLRWCGRNGYIIDHIRQSAVVAYPYVPLWELE